MTASMQSCLSIVLQNIAMCTAPTEAPWCVVQEGPIYTFVAIVPVTMDALFKYWIFKGLNRKNPAAAVTLKSMDRH